MIVHSLSEGRPAPPSVTETIVDAVSEAEDCDPLTLPPLWNVIDPEALDALFEPTRGGRPRTGRVSFVYAGYEITVDSTGEAAVAVSVEPVA
ncbi:HalOD1 output domain-containing protein [Natronorubrum sp. DTA28]|uniref:HalOD1 output domain-containing protein n=1 Tax=Natronorubrum sp. DTA28 TaxID=3447019 RepID=UPI003F838C70